MVLGRIGTTSSPYGAVYKFLKVIVPQVFLFVSVRNRGNFFILLNKATTICQKIATVIRQVFAVPGVNVQNRCPH